MGCAPVAAVQRHVFDVTVTCKVRLQGRRQVARLPLMPPQRHE
jgi:hypothetical protein